MSQLFRKEAVEHRARSLFGEVVLAGPISLWLITALLLLVIGGTAAALMLIGVETEAGRLPLWRWLVSPKAP